MHHPIMDPALAPLPVNLDYGFITRALLHSLGMGVVLMGVTHYVDSKQLKGTPKQTSIQNSSNVLFMCVAIATVIILVGNNVARAFALGAAIALIRFKMKLGESSSGSGFLFAILCGMSCAIGLHPVGWTLAIGYSLIQTSICLLVSRMDRKQNAMEAVASQNEISRYSADASLLATEPVFAEASEPATMPPPLKGNKMKTTAATTLMSLMLLMFTQAQAGECVGKSRGDTLTVSSDHSFHVSTIASLSQPWGTGECQFEVQPKFENAFERGERYRYTCMRYNAKGKQIASYSDEWEKSLVGNFFELKRRGLLNADPVSVKMLLTQSVMGNLSLHAQFMMPGNYEIAGIADLSPSPNGEWNVAFDLEAPSAGAATTVECKINRI